MAYTNADNETFTLGFICDSDISDDESVIGPLSNDGNNNYSTTLTGNLACPTFDTNAFWDFVDEYNWLFALILIGLGLPFCFAGRKLFSCIVFCVGVLVTVCFVEIIFYSTFLESTTEYWVSWVVLACSILGGLAVGYLLFKCQKLGAAFIAGWGGFLIGLVLNTTVVWLAE